ncbi:MAG: PAS domain S-box protein [Flavisolibacter sp.]
MEDDQIISLESESGFRALFEYATVGILVIGSDRCIELANPCSEKLFGYSNAELIGQPVEISNPDTFRKKHLHHRDKYFEKPKASMMGYGLNLFARRKDGFEFPVEISLGHYQLADEKLAVAFTTGASLTIVHDGRTAYATPFINFKSHSGAYS